MFEVEDIFNKKVKKYVKSELKGFNWNLVSVINLPRGILIEDNINHMGLGIFDIMDYICVSLDGEITFYEYRKGIDNEYHYFAINSFN